MFEIGIIVKPQGIRGEIRVLPTTDDPARFGLLKEVYIRRLRGTGKDASSDALNRFATGASPETSFPLPAAKYTLVSAKQQKNIVILSLAGVTDRNAAAALVGGVLCIPDEWALPLGEDEYFIRDLIGMTVQTEDGTVLGEIADVLRTGANDVYVIKAAEGDSFMVPAVKDVVLRVNLTRSCITLRLMDGLRELTV
jgi:16S rRNA processing protein RimM